MTTAGQIHLREIRRMLETCAPGAVIVPKLHHNWILYQGKTYRGLPLGKHGKRENPEIQAGQVKRMARFLGILPCAQREIPGLR